MKNPAYPPTLYVDELVARDTVNTMPEATMEAVMGSGADYRDTVTTAYDDADAVMSGLARLGISYDELIDRLEREGVDKFIASWQDLLGTVSAQLEAS